ncbi:MAG TPA: MoxR family ATPase, partial [Candidatus Xenobia bacterium]
MEPPQSPAEPAPGPSSPADLAKALEATGYLADEGLVTAAYLALRMGRPL